ncbi:MAG: sugar phosphate isomerase/epimerase family protein [Bryobacterales bacterium]|nr:sugar phosphate isomerase/epimerase [Bryobacteraceae bacterium]MDW8355114.1 sugar phosphate isomerase/epimerase family protein [Bryobacterales bacterium]
MDIEIGLNLEFIRSEDKSFAEGVARAAQLGYRYCEPLVHSGYELLSGGGYYHSFSMLDDPYEMKDVLDQHGLKLSALSAHSPLMRPEVAIPYLEQAIRFAAVAGAPVLNTDEGIRPRWVSPEEAFSVMKYTLTRVLMTAERYGIYIAIEPHQAITKTTEGLLRVATLVDSPMLRINYDTGNAWLAGADPYEGLRAAGKRVVHLHAKDISTEQSEKERGAVTGTPVGCACGDGVIDWERVVQILREIGFRGVLSVECGTAEQAARSLAHLSAVVERTARAYA